MVSQLRCYAEKMKISIMMVTFLATVCGGGYAAHRFLIGEVRAEMVVVHKRIDNVEELRSRERGELCDRLKTIESDIKQILRNMRTR